MGNIAVDRDPGDDDGCITTNYEDTICGDDRLH